MRQVAFISGHLDLTEEEFREHYEPRIRFGVLGNVMFIVGDARGADSMAQALLTRKAKQEDVVVYHMFDKPRNNVGLFKTIGGFKTDAERDRAMTEASDFDIAWVRPGREKSGTARNIARRKKKL
jgi:hypothetical protein